MRTPSRFILAMLLSVFLIGVGASGASAESADITRFSQGPLVIDNPCDASQGLLTLFVEGQQVLKTESDGTISRHFNFHGTATSAAGTEYVINQTQTWVTSPDGSFTREFFIRRISKGATDNALIVRIIVGPPDTVTVELKCAG